MLETILQGWLAVWLYVMAAIAIVLIYRVLQNRKTWDRLTILCTLAIVVLVCHVFEEWVWPGGLHYSYNISNGGTVLSCYPMNRLTDMITNFGAVVLGCIILKCRGFRKPAAGIVVLMFCCMEVFMHAAIGITDYSRFHSYGMVFWYDPGLVTSLFGFLPLAVLLFRELFLKKPRPKVIDWIIAIVSTMIFAYLLISLPEQLLKDTNSLYAFTDRGYYEQFGKQYEQDHGVTYYVETAGSKNE